MNRGRLPTAATSLNRVRLRFERWRRTRHHRSPIPDTLWAMAMATAKTQGVHQTARMLRLNYTDLKRRLAAMRSKPAQAAFVELLPQPHVEGTACTIELESARGTRLWIQFQGMAPPDLTTLSRTLWHAARFGRAARSRVDGSGVVPYPDFMAKFDIPRNAPKPRGQRMVGRSPLGAQAEPDHRSLYAGLIRLHVLHHAAKDVVYGFAMIAELRRHGYELSTGTLYPILHGLERQGLLTSSKARSGRTGRRVYRATAAGRKALSAAKAKVRELFRELVEDDADGGTRTGRRG